MKTQQTLFSLLFLTYIFLSFSSCSEKKEYTLTGKLQHEGFDGRTVYLSRLNDDLLSYTDIDSTAIIGDSFTFTGPASDSLIAYHIFIGKEGYDRIVHSPLIFIPEKGQKHVELDSDYKGTIHGTPETDRLSLLIALEDKAKKKLSLLVDSIIKYNLTDEVERAARITDIYTPVNEVLYSYLHEISGTPLFDEIFLNFRRYLRGIEIAEFEKQPSERLKRFNENTRKEYENSGKSVIGQPFLELVCKDVNGKDVQLSEFVGKGKVVLLDFWGSRCPPCLAEIPILKEIYTEYKNKGFEIISISTDTQKEDWIKAMEKQQMEWLQLLSADGQNRASKIYGFRGIPHTVLIDADGIVLKKNLRGETIREELKKILE